MTTKTFFFFAQSLQLENAELSLFLLEGEKSVKKKRESNKKYFFTQGTLHTNAVYLFGIPNQNEGKKTFLLNTTYQLNRLALRIG